MLRLAMLVLCCGVLLGTSCPAGSTLTCANNPLDGSEYGFTVTVPEKFVCQALSSLDQINVIARAAYEQESTGISVAVTVQSPQSNSNEALDGVTDEALGQQTNVNGVEFEMRKLTIDLSKVFDNAGVGMQYSYSAGATLNSGNLLIISVSADTDSQTLADELATIIATVAFTQAD